MSDDVIWGAIGGIGGTVGAVAAVISLVYAHKANSKADASNTIADDSKTLANEANKLARESNSIATAAKELAREANSYSHRAEARETERHDVHWDDDWLVESDGIYAVTKRGNDPARDVSVTVVFDGEEQTGSSELMEADGSQIVLKFPKASRSYAKELQKYRAHQAAEQRTREQASGPFPVTSQPNFVQPFNHNWHFATVRVTWVTALGTPKTWEDEHRGMFFSFK